MKITILTLALLTSFTFTTLGQETNKKVREVGVTLYNLQDYGAVFKIGKENRLWRFRALSTDFNSSTLEFQTTENFKIGISAGRERRKSVTEKLNFIYGLELSGTYFTSKIKESQNNFSRNRNQEGYSVGLIGVIGFNYFLHEKLFIGGELLPIAQFSSTHTSYSDNLIRPSYDSQSFRIGFDSNWVQLSVGLRF